MLTVDALLLELIETGRQASPEELATIIAHVAQAPFATYLSRVPVGLRHLLGQRGIIVPGRLSSLQRHLFKRIYDEEQWLVGTTADQYIADLHQAILHADVQIWTYRYLGQPFVGFFGAVPRPGRRPPGSLSVCSL